MVNPSAGFWCARPRAVESSPSRFVVVEDSADSPQRSEIILYANPMADIGATKWPSGPIPYWTDAENVTRERIESAMCWWMSVTPVKFKRAESADQGPKVLRIYTKKPTVQATDCSTSSGSVLRLRNVVKLGDCIDSRNKDAVGHIAHELGHVLGLDHEQRRPDSDKWIVVDWPAVNEYLKGDKRKKAQIAPDVLEENKLKFALTTKYPYDLNSIMHYPPDAYGGHMRPVATAPRNAVGQRVCVSEGDQKAITDIYK